MIQELLPTTVVAVEAFEDSPDAEVFPEEAALLRNAVARRRREFVSGRACARTGLQLLGVPTGPILRGALGAPLWPTGVVGSITHCDGYRAAAVARASDMRTLGIDGEPNAPLPEGVLRIVADVDERATIVERSRADPGVCWDRLLFSAKEALYKAWFPVARCWLDFADVTITFGADNMSFTARLVNSRLTALPGMTRSMTGRFLVREGLIVTAIAVPRSCSAAGAFGVADEADARKEQVLDRPCGSA